MNGISAGLRSRFVERAEPCHPLRASSRAVERAEPCHPGAEPGRTAQTPVVMLQWSKRVEELAPFRGARRGPGVANAWWKTVIPRRDCPARRDRHEVRLLLRASHGHARYGLDHRRCAALVLPAQPELSSVCRAAVQGQLCRPEGLRISFTVWTWTLRKLGSRFGSIQ